MRLPLPALATQTDSYGIKNIALKPGQNLKGRRIILIEDSANNRDALAALLCKAGAEVIALDNAASAIAEFQNRPPDCIGSDLGLPKIDGYDLMRFLRAREKDHGLPRIPALAVTAYADEKNRRKALECGFDHVLKKTD